MELIWLIFWPIFLAGLLANLRAPSGMIYIYNLPPTIIRTLGRSVSPSLVLLVASDPHRDFDHGPELLKDARYHRTIGL
jgi:hypothetical protein